VPQAAADSMAVQTTYTEAELKALAHALLSNLAGILGWTVAGGSYDVIVLDALRAYPETDIGNISGAPETTLLLACLEYALWVRVVQVTTWTMDVAAEAPLSTINRQARENLKLARERMEDARYLLATGASTDGGAVNFYQVTREDPYENLLGAETSDEFSVS